MTACTSNLILFIMGTSGSIEDGSSIYIHTRNVTILPYHVSSACMMEAYHDEASVT